MARFVIHPSTSARLCFADPARSSFWSLGRPSRNIYNITGHRNCTTDKRRLLFAATASQSDPERSPHTFTSTPSVGPLKLLYLASVWPEITSTAAGLRSWSVLRACLEAGWSISCTSPATLNPHTADLNQVGISLQQLQENDPAFDTFVRDLQPDYVFFDRFTTEEKFGWRVEDNCPSAVRVLDTQDLHFLRQAREQALKQGASIQAVKECKFELLTELALRELASLYRCDLTLIISSFELALLTHELQVPSDLLALSQFAYLDSAIPSPEFERRADFMLIGSFLHPPNVDGLFWLKKEIWPLIHAELPKARVHVYGSYPTKQAMQATDKKAGFIVEGPVVDQFEALRRHRVNLAPLRFGAGIKGKVSDGWFCGTPLVGTSIAAEGMVEDIERQWGGAIADDPQTFAREAVRLYRDPEAWRAASQRGSTAMHELYSQQVFNNALMSALMSARKRLAERRRANVTGALLRHHQHRSTKYLSQYIEVKARLAACGARGGGDSGGPGAEPRP